MLQNDHPRVYTELSDEALEALELWKGKLNSLPVLALPRSQGPYTVESDAYDRQIGYVLLQKELDGHNKPIRDWSGSLTDTERAYDTTRG